MTVIADIAELLGGRRALQAKPRSATEWLDVVRRGIPVDSAEALKRWMAVGDDVLADLLGSQPEDALARPHGARASRSGHERQALQSRPDRCAGHRSAGRRRAGAQLAEAAADRARGAHAAFAPDDGCRLCRGREASASDRARGLRLTRATRGRPCLPAIESSRPGTRAPLSPGMGPASRAAAGIVPEMPWSTPPHPSRSPRSKPSFTSARTPSAFGSYISGSISRTALRWIGAVGHRRAGARSRPKTRACVTARPGSGAVGLRCWKSLRSSCRRRRTTS